jgi:branched-chain amino acid transport system substrate-binding protein
MSLLKRLDRILIALLTTFFLCCPVISLAAEAAAPAPSAEVKSPPAKPPEAKIPASATATKPPNRNTIGCVLPMSGQYAESGNRALDAILLSAKIYDPENKKLWKVIAEDSRGVPEGARTAVERLADAENVMAIVAVCGTAEADAAALEANKRKVPLILITSKEGVTSAGEYVFQHFLTPTQQIRAIVKYALDELNCAIFSVLYPDDEYGNGMLKIFREEAKRIGCKVERAVSYDKNQTDFTEAIDKVTGNLVSTAKTKNTGKEKTKAPLNPDFEALFIPDSYQRVRLITSQLAFYDIRNIKLLGTGLWNSPYLLKGNSDFLEGAVFVDSFFADSAYNEVTAFVDYYIELHNRKPENIEALAFDTAGFVFTILENKSIQTRREFINALPKTGNYTGATGSMYFDVDRISRKTPLILKVDNGKIRQVQ